MDLLMTLLYEIHSSQEKGKCNWVVNWLNNLTNSVQEGPSLEASGPSASQEILHI
jgi:hypothetical protein